MKERPALPTSIYVAWVACGLLALASFLVWQHVFAQDTTGNLTVAFLDVGQGDSIYIETPHGNQVLIDGGKGRVVLGKLSTVMPLYDRSIDMVLATHPDTDHVEGLPEVFVRYAIGAFIEPGVHDDSTVTTVLQTLVEEEGSVVHTAQAGMSFVLDTDVTLHILFPDRDVANLETNTASIVAKLTYGDTSFLFTGDSPSGIENYLASEYGDGLQSDVLKVGHHGSNTSSSDLFLGFVAPKYAVISAGCDNSYGHPHADVLEKLRKSEAKILTTCTEGTIVFTSDGATVSQNSL